MTPYYNKKKETCLYSVIHFCQCGASYESHLQEADIS